MPDRPAYLHTAPKYVTIADFDRLRASHGDPESCPDCVPVDDDTRVTNAVAVIDRWSVHERFGGTDRKRRSTFHRTNPDISEEDFTQDYLNHLEEIIQYEGPQTIAAILIESVTGTNGVMIPPQGYMQGLRALCDKYGIVMIADEVMSGFGRTGKWFAADHWDVVPDMITMAKGLTSAYAPLGAVAMKPEIAAAFNEHAYEGGLTYTSHPVSLAAAIANINVMREDKLVEHTAGMGKVLKRMLTDLGEAHPSVGEVRNIGLFGIIELVKDRKTKEPMAPWNGSSPEMAALKKYCLDHGLFLYTHWHTVLIIPPLIITEEQLKEGFDVLDKALEITDRAAG